MEDSENIIMVKIGCQEVCEKDVLPERRRNQSNTVTCGCAGRLKTKQNKRGNQLKRETLTPCPFLGIQKPCVVWDDHTKAPKVYTHIHVILYALGLGWKI